MRLDVERGHFRRKALAHEFLEEAAVFRGEGFRGFLLEHVGGTQEHAQELGDQFGVGVAELLVAHEHGGQAHAAGIGGSGDLPALVHAEEHVRGPQADAVADAAVERREALRLIDVLAAHVVRVPVHFRVVFVIALGLEDGAVGAEQEGVGVGFVVGDGDGVRPVAERAHHAGHGAGSGEHPFPGGEGVELRHAGREEKHFNIQPFLFVPSFFFGVPDEEGFVFVKPRRTKLDRGRRECRTGKRDEEGNSKETRKHFEPSFHKKLLYV